MSDTPDRPLMQCMDCGGVTTYGGWVGDATPRAVAPRYWECLWCKDGWEGWPRVGSWRITGEDDRTYPEGHWPAAMGGGPDIRAKRQALAARGNRPPPPETP